LRRTVDPLVRNTLGCRWIKALMGVGKNGLFFYCVNGHERNMSRRQTVRRGSPRESTGMLPRAHSSMFDKEERTWGAAGLGCSSRVVRGGACCWEIIDRAKMNKALDPRDISRSLLFILNYHPFVYFISSSIQSTSWITLHFSAYLNAKCIRNLQVTYNNNLLSLTTKLAMIDAPLAVMTSENSFSEGFLGFTLRLF
jgi:hypothetical protein